MKRFIIISVLLISSLPIRAKAVDSLAISVRGSFLQETINDEYSSALKAEYFNIDMWGKMNKDLTYRIRQRMNVAIDADNPFKATDLLNLNWQASDKWSLCVGKDGILIGGYEYDSPPIDVYFYSEFCNNLAQCFSFSVGGKYLIQKDQNIQFQICNSPLTTGFKSNKYAYNLMWTGSFSQKWTTLWSANLLDDMYDRNILYLALGNRFHLGDLAWDVDYFQRASVHQKNFFSDFTVLTKLIYTTGKWNWCAKFGYDRNASDNLDKNGLAFDTVVAPGTQYFYGGVGIEYFPLGDENLRLHLACFYDNSTKVNSVALGLKWRVRVL